MRDRRGQSFTKNPKTDSPSPFLSWLQGIWSSLRRFIRRLLRPNRGRRAEAELLSADARISPLVGIEKFRHAESLTIGELMTKVRWRVPKQTAKTVPSVDSTWEMYPVPRISPVVGAEQSLDAEPVAATNSILTKPQPAPRVSPLMGIEQFPHIESSTVGNLLAAVQWRVSKQSLQGQSASSVASVQEKINWD